jgi:hypothetical protein
MTDERRNNYRAATPECPSGVLRVGRKEFWGVIQDESSGGFTFATGIGLEAKPETEAELMWNGQSCRVRIAYVRATALSARVGLQRLEMCEKRNAPKAKFGRQRLLMYALAAAGGVGLGLLLVRNSWLG